MKRPRHIIEPDSSLIRNDNLVCNEIDGEIVILNVDNGEYYTLNKTGSEVWNILEAKHTFSQIIDLMLVKYNIDKKECVSDTLPYIESMLDNGLILFTNETAR